MASDLDFQCKKKRINLGSARQVKALLWVLKKTVSVTVLLSTHNTLNGNNEINNFLLYFTTDQLF